MLPHFFYLNCHCTSAFLIWRHRENFCFQRGNVNEIMAGTSISPGRDVGRPGVNFAIYAENASKVELCLFDSADSQKESHRLTLKEYTDKVWHGYLPDVLAGQIYGYRLHGPFDPSKGHRFNPNKVVLDPYAKLIGRDVRWADELFGYRFDDPELDLSFDDRDSAPYAPLAMVDRSGVYLGR